jgi:hypothetical protein
LSGVLLRSHSVGYKGEKEQWTQRVFNKQSRDFIGIFLKSGQGEQTPQANVMGGQSMRERASPVTQPPTHHHLEVEDLSGGKQDLSEDFDIINAWLKQTPVSAGSGQI